MPRGRILIVDDDLTVAEILSRYLVRDGYEVESAPDGRVAWERTQADQPDLILLDLMLPGMSGLDFCRRVRRIAGIPIIMLTARGEENERVFGLKLGADDYIVKPFSPREVTARVGSVLRRANTPSVRPEQTEDRVIAGNELHIDLRSRTVRVGSDPIALTAREFDLLAFLALHPDQVFRRDELLERVWGYSVGDTATVTVHVRRLRSKIEGGPNSPAHIETVWGVGYRFRL